MNFCVQNTLPFWNNKINCTADCVCVKGTTEE